MGIYGGSHGKVSGTLKETGIMQLLLRKTMNMKRVAIIGVHIAAPYFWKPPQRDAWGLYRVLGCMLAPPTISWNRMKPDC